jgi:uncharacterized cupredoxin-like copper-binding protein
MVPSMKPHRFRDISLLIVLALVGAVAITGCGSKKSSSSSSSSASSTPAKTASAPAKTTAAAAAPAAAPAAAGATQTLKTAADEDGGLYFQQRKLTAKAGTVKLVMSNPSSSGIAHGIGLDGNGVDKDGPIVQAGSTSTITVKLKPGTYEFYCPIPAHKAAGMKGTLTVT